MVIIGGVAGGASAAARLRRLSERDRIVLFERGAEISFANCGMPYHIGGVIAQRQRLLVQTVGAFSQRFGVEVRARTEVVRIDRQAKTVTAVDLSTGAQMVEPYDKLVLSPGAEPIRPPLPGIDNKRIHTLRGMADMDAIKQAVDQGKPGAAVIIGGGYIGLEMAEALRGLGLKIAIVELAAQVFGVIDPEMAAPIHQQLLDHGVELHLGVSVTAFEEPRGATGPLTVRLTGGQSLECDLAILAIGVRPEVKLAREAGLEIGPTGGIAVDEHMRTSDPDIYAVGDAAEVRNFVTNQVALVPLAGPANRQGRIAADNIAGRPSTYKNTQGTAICKVFDLAVGMTGLSEKALKKAGLAYEKVYVHPSSHAGYYPGAGAISLKLLFAPDSGKILGAQAVGAKGVDKRIDVLAVALRAGMTVYDLEDLELSYAPPYGSAKDVINYAGFTAANALRGDVKLCHSPAMDAPAENQLLLDVRTPAEVEAGTIAGARNIPLDELRPRLADLPRDKELLVFCQQGLRGYLACRILSQNGFACRNLTGGYKTYRAATDKSFGAPAPAACGICEAAKDSHHANEAVKDGQRANEAAPKAAPNVGPNAATHAAPVRTVDATGLQCPGPIMKLKEAMGDLKDGQAVTVVASDCAFSADVKGWCHSTGNELVSIESADGNFRATVMKKSPAPAGKPAEPKAMNNKTIVVFSNDLDKVMAAFIIANGAAAMGSQVTLFFTFWGLNVLRKREGAAVRKTLVERMFGWMMPRGPDKLTLSKMHMGGMGTRMMKGVMAKKNIPALGQLIQSARAAGVRLVACSMSMDVMGIRAEELTDGVELGGVAMYLDQAEQGNVNLFI